MDAPSQIRWGLCCQFLDAPVRFRQATHRYVATLELLPLCERAGLPLIYDAHHHRCRADGLTVDEATGRTAATWRAARGADAEPWMHISSPRDGWDAPNPRPHADYVAPADFPD